MSASSSSNASTSSQFANQVQQQAPYSTTIANSQSRPTVSPSMASTGSEQSNNMPPHMGGRPGPGVPSDPFAKPTPEMQMHQQMLQQQQQRMGYPGGYPGGPTMGGPNQPPPMGSHQMMGGPQDPLQRQYSYSQNFFGAFDAEGDPPKRKRGRPRKNPLKEPTTAKRKYVRKKPLPPGPANPNQMAAPNPAAPGGFGGLKNVMPDPNLMANPMAAMDQGGSPSVYNFDDEEEGGLQPMRPRRNNSNHKKYSFGSSSDEDINPNKAAMMGGYPPQAQNQFNNMMNNPMMRGMTPQQQNMVMMRNQEMMHRQRMMSMQQMQQRRQQQQQQQQQQNMRQQQALHQQQQQQQQNQSMPPQTEEEISYSSEVLTKPTGGIGIKIKIKKAPEPAVEKLTIKKPKRDDEQPPPQTMSQEQQPQPQPSLQQQQQQQSLQQTPQQSQQPKPQEQPPQQPPQQQQQQPPSSGLERSSQPQPNNNPMGNRDMQPAMQRQQQQMGMQQSNSSSLPPPPQQQPPPSQQQQQQQQLHPQQQQMHPQQMQSPMNNGGGMQPNKPMMPMNQSQQVPTSNQSVMPNTSSGMVNPGGPVPGGMMNHPMNRNMMNPNSPMFQQQQMQRTMQNSPIHSGHTTPSPIRSPYNSGTTPSPQHPGFGGPGVMQGQQGMMGNFNRFPQPGMMGPNGGNFPNNYGYMQNYRMGNPAAQNMGNPQNMGNMDGNFYNNQQPMGGGGFNGMRFGSQGQFFGNQMHPQQGFNNFNGPNGPGFVPGNDFNNPQQNPMYAQQQQQQQQQQQEFYGNNPNNMGFMGQQRMMGPGDNNGGQPIPPHFRPNVMGGGNGMSSPGQTMGSPIGPPRVSPSAMHKPMPGVGMPRVSPSLNTQQGMRQTTPLVSPHSMHSDMSPSSVHNPMTPASSATTPSGLHHGGMTSPMYNNMPKTPQQQFQQQHSMMSPSPRSGPSSVPPEPSPMAEDMKSPIAAAPAPLKSPMYTGQASNLRKIRRPSKPNAIGGETSPAPPPSNEQPASVKYERIPTPVFDPKPEPVPEVKEEEPEEELPKFEARWEELEEKLWKRIFQYCSFNDGSVPFLVRAQRVCKKWKEVATSDPNLWTHLDLSQGRGMRERYRNDKKLESFLKKYNNVQELKLGGWKNAVGTSTIKVIAQFAPNLISLGLCGCVKLTNEDLKLIGESFTKLQRIDLSGVSPSSSSSRSVVSSTCLTEFITVLGNRLTVLNISNNKMAGLPFVFKALSTHSCNLEELDISNITTTSRDTININLEKFQKGCQKLRILNANHTMLSLTETPVREQVNSPGFPNLEELHIAVDSRGYFDGMDDSQIERVLAKSANLRVLDLRGCQHISNSCLIRLKSWVIERLILSGCSATSDSSESCELLVKKLAKLTELDIGLTLGERTVNNAVVELADIENPILR